MSLDERVYVMDRAGHYKAILQGIDWSTFCISWTKDSEYQIDFSCYITDSFGYSLLTNENIIEFRGQQFVIKTYNPQYADGYDTIQLSATHIGYECQYIVHMGTKAGAVSMSIQDALHWLFDGNVKGFDWEVRGNFTNRTLTDFGNVDAKSGLSTIKQYWSCEVTFDNKHVIVWSHDKYLHKLNKTIRYQHDTDQIQLTGDSTSIVNKLYCVGATGDNNQPKYFQPFWVIDTESINKWGDKTGALYQNDTPTTQQAMEAAARSTMQLNPTFSIVVTYYGSDTPEFGSQVYLEVLPMDIKEWVEITGYKIYPFDPTQSGEIDLNSLQPNILTINNSLKNDVSKAVNNAIAAHSFNDVSSGSTNQTATINVNTGELTGKIDLTLSSGVVYVDLSMQELVSQRTLGTLDEPYRPKSQRTGNFIISSDKNYIVNYVVQTDGEFNILSISDLSGTPVSELMSPVNGNFNYLI